ncbi:MULTISPECIES: HNH endonuclease signature motif containing protein [unclassified Corynebacterium]|uniref:HNH endonuclease signature motif containing protein n=1 Tax=unclassified Corynebacterium TaxID=2624378 RepID=UPI001EF61AC7|nr:MULTISPECIES: HNH endonuclease signature motif containing protein [unclassified Corynebacterium]MCG7290283.1 HNH endonuclease [Corynebacterium sp. ACRPZ]MCG7294385.1 HNH endonuclease [Corynebacterium sp. ACRPY]
MTIAVDERTEDRTGDLSAEVLEDQIKCNQLSANHHRARMLDAVGQFDEQGLAEQYGEKSTATWLRSELNLPQATAFEYVRVARGLRKFRLLFDAFESGVMPYSTVRFLLQYLEERNEEQYVQLALSMSFADLQLVLAGARPKEEDPTEPYARARECDDGMLAFEARLPAVAGQKLLTALKVAQLASFGLEDVDPDDLQDPENVQKLIDDAAAAEDAVPSEQDRAPQKRTKITMDDIVRSVSRYGPPEKQDVYGALLAMIDMVRANPKSPLRSPGVQVNLMVNQFGQCWMPENRSASSEDVRSYLANAMVRLHLLDDTGLTIHVGRSRRFATDGQVQALLAIWGYQCAMPGCSHRRFIEMHHIKEWEHGGMTDLDNLIPLCSSCHSQVSHGVITIERQGADLFFTFKNGARFVSRNRALPRRMEYVTGDSFAV